MWHLNIMISHAILHLKKRNMYSTVNKFCRNFMKMKMLKSQDTALIFFDILQIILSQRVNQT